MIEIEVFKPYHVELMRAQGVQGTQLHEVSHVPDAYASLGHVRALTAREGERILMCGGVVPFLPNVGLLWALLAEDSGRHMLWLHRATQRFLEMQTTRRLEASVEKGFSQGCRWLKLMGFQREGVMRAYGLNGEDHIRYARVRV